MQMILPFASVVIDPDITKEFLLFAVIQAADWPIWWLLIATALITEFLIYLLRTRILPPQLLQEVIRIYHNSKINDDVLTNLASNSPLGKVLAARLGNIDVMAAYQTVVNVMRAARLASFGRIKFVAHTSGHK